MSSNTNYPRLPTPQEYSALAKQLCPYVEVQFVAKSEIDQQCTFLDTKWEQVMAVPQIHKVHCIQTSGADEVRVADISSEIEKCSRVCRIRKSSVTEQDSPIEDEVQPTLNLSMGQWVVVNYDGEMFPGEVTHIDNSDIEVVSCIEVQTLGSGQDLKTKSSTQEMKLYVSLNHQVLQLYDLSDRMCRQTALYIVPPIPYTTPFP